MVGGGALLGTLAAGTGTAAVVLLLARRPGASAAALGVTGAYAGAGALMAREGLVRLRAAGPSLPDVPVQDEPVEDAEQGPGSAKRRTKSAAKAPRRTKSAATWRQVGSEDDQSPEAEVTERSPSAAPLRRRSASPGERPESQRSEDTVANPLQERYAEVLLDRIRSDTHPSATHMNMFESIAPRRQLVEYILYLLETIEKDQHPSIPMMRRVQGLISGFGV